MRRGWAREDGSADHDTRYTLTVEVLREEDSGVRGHCTAPARIVDVVASAIDAAILRSSVTFHAVPRSTGFTERSALQA